MAAFLVPRETLRLPPNTAAIVARMWEVEAMESLTEEL